MNTEIQNYHQKFEAEQAQICTTLATIITANISQSEGKIWHGHPVWFIDGNPIVGYSKQKPGIRLMFWSGADFEEAELIVRAGKFKDASIFYNQVSEIQQEDLKRWLEKSLAIQWDYKNIIKRKGVLLRLK